MQLDTRGTSVLASEPRRRRVTARLAILPLPIAASVAIAASRSAAGVRAAAAPRCDVNDEHLTYFPAGGAAGTLFEKFVVRHRGKGHRCTLRGYPEITLIGKHGRVLPIKVRHDHSRKVRTR